MINVCLSIDWRSMANAEGYGRLLLSCHVVSLNEMNAGKSFQSLINRLMELVRLERWDQQHQSLKTPDELMMPAVALCCKDETMAGDMTPVERRSWAWADPENSYNVDRLINNGIHCRWSVVNCGANEETFSFHTGGANVVLCDGSVHFLSDSITAVPFIGLMSARGGEVVSISDF